MNQSKNHKFSSKNHYDVAVVGGGLSALIAANLWSRAGVKVVLVAPEAEWGGEHKLLNTPVGSISQGFDFLPDFPRTQTVLSQLSTLLGFDLTTLSFDSSPLTYDSGHFKEFVGFGKDAPLALEPVSQFIRSPQFQRLNLNKGEWVQSLISALPSEQKISEHVTQITIEENLPVKIELNGQKEILAEEVFYCMHPMQLTKLVKHPQLNPKLGPKIAKRGFWTTIHLSVVHSKVVSTEESIVLLMGAKKDPVVGFFDSPLASSSTATSEDSLNSDESLLIEVNNRLHETGDADDAKLPAMTQTSRWSAFIPFDAAEDHDLAAQTLREMKKQIMRAFPESLNNLCFERVMVSPGDYGPVGEIFSGEFTLKKIDHLWLAGGLFSTLPGLLGELEQPLRAFQLAHPEASVDAKAADKDMDMDNNVDAENSGVESNQLAESTL